MNSLGLRFHHLGLAVRSDGETVNYLRLLGYHIGELVYDARQNVNLRMCFHATEPAVEIVMPGVGDGPLTPILQRSDQQIYHVCYEVDDLDKCLDAMDLAGLSVFPVASPKPAILFNERRVSFCRIDGFGVIELLES